MPSTLDHPIVDNRYTSTVISRALRYVEALDQGKTAIDAYMIAHPGAKYESAKAHTYQYKLSQQVTEAIRYYYKGLLPSWATSQEGLAAKLCKLDAMLDGDRDAVDTARKVIMDIAKVQGLIDPDTKITIDNRQVHLTQEVKDKLIDRVKSLGVRPLVNSKVQIKPDEKSD